MDKRQQELTQLRVDTENIEKKVTLLIQNLQWNPERITEKRLLVACKHDPNHRIPMDDRDKHEKQCYLSKLGYRKEDTLLPDPVDPDSKTLVKFSKHQIAEIINNAAVNNPLFKRGVGCPESEPLSVERLQLAYSADERRAIHDAVVNSVPCCHDLAELDLLSSNNDVKTSQKKSRLEILAELRNMKRRRTKYRVPPKTRNYSDVLRDVIKTQMDSYGETSRTIIKTEYGPNIYVSQKVSNKHSQIVSQCDVVIKLERESPEPHCYNKNTGDYTRDRYKARSRENVYNDDRSGQRKDNFQTSKEKYRSYGMSHQSEQSRSYSTERTREKRYDDKRNYHTEFSSRQRNKHDDSHQSDNIRDSKDKSRYDDERHTYRKEYSSKDKNNTFESYKRGTQTRHDIVKQERESQESESYTDCSRDRQNKSRSRERRHDDAQKAHIKIHSKDRYDDRRKIRSERYSSEKVIKQETESPEYDSFNSGETSRKRQRSRSKERRHKDKKRRHEKDKHSSKRVKKHDGLKRKLDFTPEIIIKQEQESS